MTDKQIAVLSNNERSPWLKQLTEVLGTLGITTVFTEDMFAIDEGLKESFNLLVVDASGLQMELAERVCWLHGRFSEVPIVVLTSSPTWRRAKAVLQAGAADYMPRSIDNDTLLARCRSQLHCPP